MSSYSEVRLRGGPADDQIVMVHNAVWKIRVVPYEPLVREPWNVSRRWKALFPVHIYDRDVNYPEVAAYRGVEE